jgi:hypothetical protein
MVARKLAAATVALTGALSVPLGSAFAADTYVQPQLDLRAEANDNFDLDPDGGAGSDVYGFIADLQALIGIATPRSDTSIRPRIRLQEYPDREDLERFEGFLDLRSQYRWERSQSLLVAKYSRQDTYNEEQPSGSFDPLDPTDSPTPDSGQRQLGETRDRFRFLPSYTFDATERTKVGVAAEYQAVRFDADAGSSNVDYDYLTGSGFVAWALDARSDVSAGLYASRYEATDDSSTSDALGAELGYQYRWSESIGAEVAVFYEEDDSTDFGVDESSSGWGGTVTGYYQGEVSRWRATAGRTFIPTGSGGRAESDQVRLQYDRDFSARLSFSGAGIYESRNSLTERGSNNDRDYARADFKLTWLMTSTWFIEGGYSYIWEDRVDATGDAYNNRIFAGVGYKGLGRQRR